MNETLCPCGTQKPLNSCCLPFIDQKAAAGSAEQLMRSRYTAFALARIEYIRATTDPQALHDFDYDSNLEWATTCKFKKLEILSAREDGAKGFIEFKAHYLQPDGNIHIHHEHSKFRKQNGTWYFRDGKVIPMPPASPS